jgi:hypothetical protein
MVGIPQIGLLGVELNKFELPGSNPDMLCFSPHSCSNPGTIG